MRPTPSIATTRQHGRVSGSTLAVLGVIALVSLLLWRTLHWGRDLVPAAFAYPPARPASCAKVASPADADATLPVYRVRTPANYDASYAHPLLIVFSPAGFGPGLTERFTGLTAAATARGLIVVYVASRPLSRELPAQLASLPARIAGQWCIEAARISFAGHSDGGTLSQVVALQAAAPGRLAPRAIVASAAGVQDTDFPELSCPTGATNVLLLHGRKDTHFPAYGASAARGWARCLGCDAEPAIDAEGCARYTHCRGDLRLCEHDGGHLAWPALANRRIVEAASAP